MSDKPMVPREFIYGHEWKTHDCSNCAAIRSAVAAAVQERDEIIANLKSTLRSDEEQLRQWRCRLKEMQEDVIRAARDRDEARSAVSAAEKRVKSAPGALPHAGIGHILSLIRESGTHGKVSGRALATIYREQGMIADAERIEEVAATISDDPTEPTARLVPSSPPPAACPTCEGLVGQIKYIGDIGARGGIATYRARVRTAARHALESYRAKQGGTPEGKEGGA